MRKETGVRIGEGESAVLHQHFVQQRGAGSPVSDDEDRRMRYLSGLDLPAVARSLDTV